MNDAISVAQFNEVINLQVQSLGAFSVVGEVTEKRVSRNSGLMMTVKDPEESAILKVSGFAPRVKGINAIDIGMKVVVTGSPQLYSPFGVFSLQAVSVVPYGEGSLKAAFEKLKKILETKGYFAVERKRALPDYITKIVLITADQSAAQTDFLKILKETRTSLDIDFIPVTVQGKNSIDEVTRALNSVSADQADCVVLTRGGGSLEDLISFNAEEVADAVFACKIPVISAVGHERDTSISDLVADIVASTPSQVAYYLSEHNLNFIENQNEKLTKMQQTIVQELQRLDYSRELFGMQQKIKYMMQALDYSRELLNMRQKINYVLETLDYSREIGMMDRTISQLLNTSKLKIHNYKNLLRSLNPEEVLKRGYSLARMGNKIIRSTKDVRLGEIINIQLSKGSLDAEVNKINS